MIDKKDLIIGQEYNCMANDIISEWSVKLTWTGDGWHHNTENIDGYYPCIVHEVIEKAN